jgi:ABC-type branched-subunit amino acid transport system permease subunit
MLALINPVALPALRIAGTIFLIINLLGIVYIFRNRHRFFDQDSDVSGDIPAVRKLRVEVILIPWFFLTTYLLVLLIELWRD